MAQMNFVKQMTSAGIALTDHQACRKHITMLVLRHIRACRKIAQDAYPGHLVMQDVDFRTLVAPIEKLINEAIDDFKEMRTVGGWSVAESIPEEAIKNRYRQYEPPNSRLLNNWIG